MAPRYSHALSRSSSPSDLPPKYTLVSSQFRLHQGSEQLPYSRDVIFVKEHLPEVSFATEEILVAALVQQRCVFNSLHRWGVYSIPCLFVSDLCVPLAAHPRAHIVYMLTPLAHSNMRAYNGGRKRPSSPTPSPVQTPQPDGVVLPPRAPAAIPRVLQAMHVYEVRESPRSP